MPGLQIFKHIYIYIYIYIYSRKLGHCAGVVCIHEYTVDY
jgi:hypothetical protein